MRRSGHYISRWFDPHLILVWLLTLPAALPLFQTTITRSADGLLHLYRLVALGHALEQGVFFSRWLPDLAYGYGFPLFVFYAPLSYYITLALQITGVPTIAVFNASFILALLLAGSGVYLFVKDLYGPRAGVLAGTAYVYAPFQLYNILSRGGLPAAWALALFPYVFWALNRLIRTASPGIFTPMLAFSAIIFGLALLTHNTMSLLFVPLIGLFVIFTLLDHVIDRNNRQRGQSVFKQVVRIAIALTLGLCLAAFFLLPAILEQTYAQVERVITTPDFDYRFNFVTLSSLFSIPEPANTGLQNPEFPLTLGIGQVSLAVIGLLALASGRVIRYRRQRPGNNFEIENDLWGELPPGLRRFLQWRPLSKVSSPSSLHHPIIGFAIITLAIAIFMMLPQSAIIWDRLPLIAFTQFPHRFLGPAAFLIAIIAGIAASLLSDRVSFGLTIAGLSLVFVTTAPLLYQPYDTSVSSEPSLVDMMAYEQATGVIGTTSFGEYLPIWVKDIPPGSPLEPMYQTEVEIKRLEASYLPAEANLEKAVYGFNHSELVINSPEAYQAIFHIFYFPGWEALIDGRPSPIEPVTERGLVGVNLPPGKHQIQLTFRETPIRQLANGLSVVGVLAAIGLLAAAMLSKRRRVNPSRLTETKPAPLGFNRNQLVVLFGFAALIIGVKLFYLDRLDNPLKREFDGATVAGAAVSNPVIFGDRIELLGYTLDRSVIVPGETFDLAAFWKSQQPLATNYSALAQLVDAEGNLYAGQDNLHPGTVPTTRWQTWGFVQDHHAIPVPHATPPGNYFVVIGLYDPITWARLPVTKGGSPVWNDVAAIPVTVNQPDQLPSIDQLNITWPVVLEPDGTSPLLLLGVTPEREAIVPNDFLRVALFWEAQEKPSANYHVNLRLLSANGGLLLEERSQPSHNRYPTTLWEPGERVRDNHALWIPADFPQDAGPYRLQIQLVDEAGQAVGEWVELGTLNTPE